MISESNGRAGRRTDDQSNRRPNARTMMPHRPKEDAFVKNGIVPDDKDVKRLQRYITPQGKIQPRRRTGLTAKTQRRLTTAIKRARHLALLPFVGQLGR